MKLSTKSRYGTRLLLDLAANYEEGYIQLGEIAKRLDVSMKYLEQIILPLKHKNYVTSARGARGGHRLARPPEDIRVGDVVALLEGGEELIDCARNPTSCEKVDTCVTRALWREAAQAMFDRLNAVTLADLLEKGGELCCPPRR